MLRKYTSNSDKWFTSSMSYMIKATNVSTTAAIIPAMISSSIMPSPPATFLSAQPIGGGLIMSKKRNKIKAIRMAISENGLVIYCQKSTAPILI